MFHPGLGSHYPRHILAVQTFVNQAVFTDAEDGGGLGRALESLAVSGILGGTTNMILDTTSSIGRGDLLHGGMRIPLSITLGDQTGKLRSPLAEIHISVGSKKTVTGNVYEMPD